MSFGSDPPAVVPGVQERAGRVALGRRAGGRGRLRPAALLPRHLRVLL